MCETVDVGSGEVAEGTAAGRAVDDGGDGPGRGDIVENPWRRWGSREVSRVGSMGFVQRVLVDRGVEEGGTNGVATEMFIDLDVAGRTRTRRRYPGLV